MVISGIANRVASERILKAQKPEIPAGGNPHAGGKDPSVGSAAALGAQLIGRGGRSNQSPGSEPPTGAPQQTNALRGRIAELREDRARLVELLSTRGGGAGTTTTVEEIDRIDAELARLRRRYPSASQG